MNATQASGSKLNIRAPEGPIRDKWLTFVWGGEPGYLPHVKEWAFIGSVGTGKTNALVSSLLLSAAKYPGSRIALVNSTRTALERSTLQTLFQVAEPLMASGKLKYYPSKNKIVLRHGDGKESEIFLFGLDVPNADKALVGTEWFRVYVDQLERIKQDVYDLLLTRVRQKVYNPDGTLASNHAKSTANMDEGRRNWLYKRFEVGAEPIGNGIYRKRVEGQIGDVHVITYRAFIRATFGENKSLNPQYAEMLALAGNTAGSFISDEWETSYDLIFFDFENEKHVVDYGNPDLSRHDLYVAVDVGAGNSPSVALFALYDRATGRATLVEEVVMMGSQVSDFGEDIGYLARKYRGVRNVFVYVDPNAWNDVGLGQTPADVLFDAIKRASGMRVYIGKAYTKGSIRIDETAVVPVKEALKSGRLKIDRRVANTIETLSSITWADVRRDKHPLTDIFDAIRYLVYNLPAGVEDGTEDEDEDVSRGNRLAWWRI